MEVSSFQPGAVRALCNTKSIVRVVLSSTCLHAQCSINNKISISTILCRFTSASSEICALAMEFSKPSLVLSKRDSDRFSRVAEGQTCYLEAFLVQ